MNTDALNLSSGFQQLYCDASVFEGFSALHPISFKRVLPFQVQDPVADDSGLITAEAAHLATRNDQTRRDVVEAYRRCGLLGVEDAASLKSVIDYFDADFFDIMGLVYANAGMFICALRWYREFIAELETRSPDSCSDSESVYASVGYCLYGLGLFEEAVAWSKSCIGPRLTADVVCRALIGYEAQSAGGRLLAIERAINRARYTASAIDPGQAQQGSPRLKAAINAFAPFQEIYIDWVSRDAPAPGIKPGSYPFRAELGGDSLMRHKMNLLFATCGQADALAARGHNAEAKRLLYEAAMLEPAAGFVWDKIKALP